jgi:hypothetical protein
MPEPTAGDSTGYASQALAEVERRRIHRPRDRWVHAAANAGFGLLIGLWIGPGRLTYADGANFWATLIYLLLLVGLAAWQTRAASTWPRRGRLISYTGAAGCILIGAFVHMALNWYAQEHPLTMPLLLGAAGVIALPLIVSGAVLATRRPR